MTKELINKQIGNRIKNLRKNANLTLLDLANKVGLSEGNVQRYESGNITNVSVAILEKFANALNTTTAELMGWEEEQEGYYNDPEVSALAEEARTNKDLKVLFSASKNLSKENMQKALDFIKFLKSQEKNESDFSE